MSTVLVNGPDAAKEPSFSNLVPGPVCGYIDNVSKKQQLRDMVAHNFYPVSQITKGDFFKEHRDKFEEPYRSQTKGFILCLGYKFTHYE